MLYVKHAYTGFGELEEFVSKHANFAAQRIPPARGLPQFDAPQQTAEALRSFWKSTQPTQPLPSNVRFHGNRFIGSA